MTAKKTLAEAKAAKPLDDMEAKWGQGLVHGDWVVTSIYKTHVAAPAGHGKRGAAK